MRGQITSTMVLYVIKFGVLSLLFFLLKGIGPYVLLLHINTNEVESSLFTHQLLTKILTYEKDDYAQMGILDVTKMNQLDQHITYETSLAARIRVVNATDAFVAETFFKKEKYDLWSVLLGKRGSGGTEKYETTQYILYTTKEGLVPGKITVSVVMPRG